MRFAVPSYVTTSYVSPDPGGNPTLTSNRSVFTWSALRVHAAMPRVVTFTPYPSQCYLAYKLGFNAYRAGVAGRTHDTFLRHLLNVTCWLAIVDGQKKTKCDHNNSHSTKPTHVSVEKKQTREETLGVYAIMPIYVSR